MSVDNSQIFCFMAKTKQQKDEIIKTLTNGLKNAKATVFANFQGLSVSDVSELRDKCREQDIDVFVAKKTLIKKVCDDLGVNADPKAFAGGVATFFGKNDEVVAAKTVHDFAKTHKEVVLFGGVLDGIFVSAEKVTSLAQLPSREQLLAKMVGTINAPLSGLVNVLAGNLRGLVCVLNAYKESKA
jgi:large subunit ribosomal protein L10